MRIAHYLWLVAVICFSQHSQAQDISGSAPLKMLGNHLIIPITYKTSSYEKQSHIIIDYSRDSYFVMHGNVYSGLVSAMAPGEALNLSNDAFSLDIVLSDKDRVTVAASGSTPIDKLTAEYDVELNNTDISGIFGFRLLKDYAVNLNINEGIFRMLPSDNQQTELVRQQSDIFIPSLNIINGQPFISVFAEGNAIGNMELSTTDYHTILTPEAAAKLPSVQNIRLGTPPQELNLSALVAIRTKALANLQDDTNIAMRSGVGLLQGLNIWLDATAGYMALSQTRTDTYQQEDVEFYQASQQENRNALYQYLQAYPTSRHIEEAVDEFFQLSIKHTPAIAASEYLSAFNFALAQMKARRRLEYMFDYCQLANKPEPEFDDITIAICEEGLKYVAYTQSPAMRQPYQLILGERFLRRNDAQTAWKYFLSASFNGAPELDAETQFGLARSYEAMKRYRRAYSTYKRLAATLPVAIQERLGIQQALVRLANELEPDDSLLQEQQ